MESTTLYFFHIVLKVICLVITIYCSNYIVYGFTGTGGHYWIGLTDQVKDGTFIWWYANTALTYKDWGPLEPNNVPSFTNPEDCVILYSIHDGKWADASCSWDCYPICEGNKRF